MIAPNVSTPWRSFTKTFWLAILLAAMVNSIVTVAGSPSGTQATKIPMAKLIAREALLLLTGKAMPKNMRAVRIAIDAIIFTNVLISRDKGDIVFSSPAVRVAICPSTVLSPVRITMPYASPENISRDQRGSCNLCQLGIAKTHALRWNHVEKWFQKLLRFLLLVEFDERINVCNDNKDGSQIGLVQKSAKCLNTDNRRDLAHTFWKLSL